ncbi:helix-turn-helix transcriptional regulator [Vibrio parahaemolyticus]|nr:helix-turn-helix transcriptional regulator [Vibrio parahaemolyticus]EGQ8533117.1 helix-turn-helix domain-containing protein [Vibrio parahaemolyticus]
MQRIKEVRLNCGIQAHELAKELGVTASAVGHYENNRRTPNVDVARRIVAAINALGGCCTFDDVFPNPEKETAQ